jgi:hypothetical protein
VVAAVVEAAWAVAAWAAVASEVAVKGVVAAVVEGVGM